MTCEPFLGTYDILISHFNNTMTVPSIERKFGEPMNCFVCPGQDEISTFLGASKSLKNAVAIKDAVVGLL